VSLSIELSAELASSAHMCIVVNRAAVAKKVAHYSIFRLCNQACWCVFMDTITSIIPAWVLHNPQLLHNRRVVLELLNEPGC